MTSRTSCGALLKGEYQKTPKYPMKRLQTWYNISLHVHLYYCACLCFIYYLSLLPAFLPRFLLDFFSMVIFLFPFSYLQVPLLPHFIHLLSAPSSSFLLCPPGLSLRHSLFLQSFPNRYIFFLIVNFYSYINQLIWVLASLSSRLTTPLSILFVFLLFSLLFFFGPFLSAFHSPALLRHALEYLSPYSFILLSFWANAFFLLSSFISFSCSLRQLLPFISLFPISLTLSPSPFPQASSSPHLKFLLDVNLWVTCRTRLFVSYKQTWFVKCTIQYV